MSGSNDGKKENLGSLSRDLSDLLGGYEFGNDAGNKLIRANGLWEKHTSEWKNTYGKPLPIFVAEYFDRLDYLLMEWIEKKRPTKAIVRDLKIVEDQLREEDPNTCRVPWKDMSSEDLRYYASHFSNTREAIQEESTRVRVNRKLEQMRELVRTQYPEHAVEMPGRQM